MALQAKTQLQEALKSKEGGQGNSAAALSRLQGELEAERSGAEALRQKIRMLEAAVAQVGTQQALCLWPHSWRVWRSVVRTM